VGGQKEKCLAFLARGLQFHLEGVQSRRFQSYTMSLAIR
jgi:hypothetical protein